MQQPARRYKPALSSNNAPGGGRFVAAGTTTPSGERSARRAVVPHRAVILVMPDRQRHCVAARSTRRVAEPEYLCATCEFLRQLTKLKFRLDILSFD